MLQVRQKALGRDIKIPPISWSPPCRPELAATLIPITPAQLSEKKFIKIPFVPFCCRDEAFLQPFPRTPAPTKSSAKEIQAQSSVLGKKCGGDSSTHSPNTTCEKLFSLLSPGKQAQGLGRRTPDRLSAHPQYWEGDGIAFALLPNCSHHMASLSAPGKHLSFPPGSF